MVFGLKHQENFVSPMTIFRDFLFVVGACGCGCFSFLYLLFFFIIDTTFIFSWLRERYIASFFGLLKPYLLYTRIGLFSFLNTKKAPTCLVSLSPFRFLAFSQGCLCIPHFVSDMRNHSCIRLFAFWLFLQFLHNYHIHHQ